MDENTWRFAQCMMWLIGIQTAFLTAALAFVWSNLSKRSDRLDDKIDKMDDRIDRLDEKVSDMDKRLFGIETMLHMKDCCVLKSDQDMRKAG